MHWRVDGESYWEYSYARISHLASSLVIHAHPLDLRCLKDTFRLGKHECVLDSRDEPRYFIYGTSRAVPVSSYGRLALCTRSCVSIFGELCHDPQSES